MKHADRPDTDARRMLRRQLLARRAALPARHRLEASRRIAARIGQSAWLAPGSAIGLYASHGSEVDTGVLRSLAWQRGCRVYLPRILDYRARAMGYCRDPGGPLLRNRFGIAEPAATACTGARWFGVLLLPLVGFDARGHRLGSGAGYYDRLLAFRRNAPRPPLLVGLAFECQRCAMIEAAPHDVPLDAVVTENVMQFFNPET